MRAIKQIAADIERCWPKPYFGAVPYLQAMRSLETVNDQFGWDSADSIIRYALGNMQTFRGPEARKLKAELKQHLS